MSASSEEGMGGERGRDGGGGGGGGSERTVHDILMTCR